MFSLNFNYVNFKVFPYTKQTIKNIGSQGSITMSEKEARARIKINNLLQEAGWRFLDDENGKANILLENHIKISQHQLDEFGEDFEKTTSGFVDFLLLDEQGFPAIVLEAKAEDKNPLIGKEQARKYARAQNCRFILLSNGNSHYLWDLEHGSPHAITRFPSPKGIKHSASFKPNTQTLVREVVDSDYIVKSQRPDYQSDPAWKDETSRSEFLLNNKLRFLRPYQVNAIKAVQQAVDAGKDRFLLEMATGTGKTLVSAALIRLFLRTANARRVLFLVDRLELEDQAKKRFTEFLKNDYHSVVYKENADGWRHAEIVISTIQTFLSNNRYLRKFNPNDFDLVISDEAHRSINGNARAVFEYFTGYKLGLTATPRDYLKNIDPAALSHNDPRELERRILLDTYRTFGCEDGKPTFSYSLLDGVKDGFLINPTVVDARTDITTQLLSDKGYAVKDVDENGNESEDVFGHRDFEHSFFSEATNAVFCKTFLENALRDPISGEIGKTIIFTVSQNHAAKIAQMLNWMADKAFPGRYQSDFALQVTSSVMDAQQFTINFANNNLNGSAHMLPNYKTSKTRVCVTVGMMTTGYDCEDILNLCLMRPIFSPTDFIQIKGRGTRTYDFARDLIGKDRPDGDTKKQTYKLFDFFANCEYFEEDFNYDEELKLPALYHSRPLQVENPPQAMAEFEYTGSDYVTQISEQRIGLEGMRIDRMYFQRFEAQVKADPAVQDLVKQGDLESAARMVEEKYFDKPEDYFNLDRLRKAVNTDRLPSLREFLELIFGYIPYIKTREELLDDEFNKFDARRTTDEQNFQSARNFFKSYVLDPEFRLRVERGEFGLLIASHAGGEFLRSLSVDLRNQIIGYIKDNVSLNQFT